MDERLRNYLDKHLTPGEQEAARTGSAINKQLIVFLVLTAACTLFFNWVSADMDRKIAHSNSRQSEAMGKKNPWSKD